MTDEAPRILLVPGSLRRASASSAVLATAQEVAPAPMATELFDGLGDLPHFNPDHDGAPLPPPVAALRTAIHRAHAILFCTPEYAGALPGSFKNLLDWTIGDGEPGSIYEKPVAWINASASGGAAGAHASLRDVLGYAHARIVEAACAEIPVPRQAVAGGRVADPELRRAIARSLMTLAAHR